MTARVRALVRERVEDLGSAGGLPSGPNFSGLSRTDTIFILDDGLTRLLLRWKTPSAALENLYRCFPAPRFSRAETREGCRAGFEPGAAGRTNHLATPHPKQKLL